MHGLGDIGVLLSPTTCTGGILGQSWPRMELIQLRPLSCREAAVPTDNTIDDGRGHNRGLGVQGMLLKRSCCPQQVESALTHTVNNVSVGTPVQFIVQVNTQVQVRSLNVHWCQCGGSVVVLTCSGEGAV